MKRLATILLALTILISSIGVVVHADQSTPVYYKVTYSDAVLYTSADTDTVKFSLIPDTYVQMISLSTGVCKVSYMGVEGYISRDHLSSSPAEAWVTNYHHQTKTVSASRKSFLYTSVAMEDSIAEISKNDILTIIGIYTVGGEQLLYCRDALNRDGYVAISDTSWSSSDTLVPPTNTPTTEPNPDTGNNPNTPPSDGTISDNADPLRIILILGICIPAGIIVYLLFKPVAKVDNRYISDSPKKRGYFEVEDVDYDE